MPTIRETIDARENQYTELIDSMIKKQNALPTELKHYTNTEIVKTLYSMICDYHHFEDRNQSDIDMIKTIDNFLIADRIVDNIKQSGAIFDYYWKEMRRNVFDQEPLYKTFKSVAQQYRKLKINEYLNVYKGYRLEKITEYWIRNLLPEKDYVIYPGYTHRNISNGLSMTSENDLLIISRKGLFTIEIKSVEHNSVVIQSSGAMLYDNKPVENNPMAQCIQHKLNLSQMLDKQSMNSDGVVHSILYLENCKSIDNQFCQAEAYNNISLLTNAIMSKPNIFSEEKMTSIIRLLKSNACEHPAFAFESSKINCYKADIDFIHETRVETEKMIADREKISKEMQNVTAEPVIPQKKTYPLLTLLKQIITLALSLLPGFFLGFFPEFVYAGFSSFSLSTVGCILIGLVSIAALGWILKNDFGFYLFLWFPANDMVWLLVQEYVQCFLD